MDDTTGRLTGEDAARAREIQEEIQETRVEMAETIEAIQERLTPSNLVAQAGETVRNAATEKVKQMANTAGRAADQVMENPVVETVRSNPIPAAMIGIGAAWLFLKGRSESSRYSRDRSYSRYRYNSGHGARDWRQGASSDVAVGTSGSGYGAYGESSGAGNYGETTGAGSYGDTTRGGYGERTGAGSYQGASGSTAETSRGSDVRGGYGSEYGSGEYDSSRYGSSGAQWSGRHGAGVSVDHVVREYPLALGAAAAIVGAAIGMSMPRTDTEDRLMGDARDNVVDRAKEMASDAAEKVQDVAGKAADSATRVANAAGNAADAAGSETISSSTRSTSRKRQS